MALIYDYSDGRKLVYDSMINNMHYGLEEQILGHLGTLEMETNRAYWENPAPAPGMKQLVEDIDKGEVRTSQLAEPVGYRNRRPTEWYRYS